MLGLQIVFTSFWVQIFAAPCPEQFPLIYTVPVNQIPGFEWNAVWNSDGTILAVSSAQPSRDGWLIGLFDLEVGNFVRWINDTQALYFAWIPNQDLIAVGTHQNTVTIWNTTTITKIQTLYDQQGTSKVQVACGPFLCASFERYFPSVMLWNTSTWLFVRNNTLPGWVNQLEIHPTTGLIAVGYLLSGTNYAVDLWQSNGLPLMSNVFTCSPQYFAWNTGPSPQLVATCIGVAFIFDANSLMPVKALPFSYLGDVQFLDNWRLVSYSIGLGLGIFNTFRNSYDPIVADGSGCSNPSVNPRGIVACLSSFGLRFYDLATGPVVDYTYTKGTVAWSKNGQLAICNSSNNIQIWDRNQSKIVKTIGPLPHSIGVVAWSLDSTKIAAVASGSPANVSVWDVSTGALVFNSPCPNASEAELTAIAWHASGKIASLVGSPGGGICVWDSNTGLLLYDADILSADGGNQLSWNVDGTLIAASSYVYNLTSLTLENLYAGCLFSGDGLMTRLVQNRVEILREENPLNIISSWNFAGNGGYGRVFAWGPKGILGIASTDTISLYDAYSGTLGKLVHLVDTIQAYLVSNCVLAFSSDYFLAVATNAGTTIVRTSIVTNFSFHPDGDQVTFQITGKGLDTRYKWLQLYEYPTCSRVTLDTNFRIRMARSPGLKMALFRDSYAENDPWISFQSLLVDCSSGQQPSANKSCENCPINTFQLQAGLSACSSCPGMVTNNRTTCETCPLYASRSSDGTSCICTDQFYTVAGINSSLSCSPCPAHGVCEGGTIRAQDGWWRTQDPEIEFLPCAIPSVCQGGSCTAGYRGALCGECAPGFGQTGINRCLECGSSGTNKFVAAILVLVLIAVCIILATLSMRANATESNVATSVLKVGVSSAQVNTLLMRMDVLLPSWLSSSVSILDGMFGSSEINFTLSCVFLDAGYASGEVIFAFERFMLIFPLVGLLSFLIILVLVHKIRVCRNPEVEKASKLKLTRWFVTGSATALFTFHPTIVLATLRLFFCRPVNAAHTDYRLSGDIAAHCYDTTYDLHVALVAVPMLIFYVILPPLAAFLYMRRLPRDQVLDETANMVVFLCAEYNEEHYWWFLVVIFRKVIAVICVAFASGVTQLSLISIMFVCFLVAHLRVRPYSGPLRIVDISETASLVVSICVFSLAQLFLSNEVSNEGVQAAGVIVVLLMVAFYGFIVYIILNHLRKKWKANFDQKLQKSNGDIPLD